MRSHFLPDVIIICAFVLLVSHSLERENVNLLLLSRRFEDRGLDENSEAGAYALSMVLHGPSHQEAYGPSFAGRLSRRQWLSRELVPTNIRQADSISWLQQTFLFREISNSFLNRLTSYFLIRSHVSKSREYQGYFTYIMSQQLNLVHEGMLAKLWVVLSVPKLFCTFHEVRI